MTAQGSAGQSPNYIAGLISVLESDFRQLSHDARKTEGFASFFGNADNQPEVKEAAERAVMKIRSLVDNPNALEQIRNSKVSSYPLIFYCTKNTHLNATGTQHPPKYILKRSPAGTPQTTSIVM